MSLTDYHSILISFDQLILVVVAHAQSSQCFVESRHFMEFKTRKDMNAERYCEVKVRVFVSYKTTN